MSCCYWSHSTPTVHNPSTSYLTFTVVHKSCLETVGFKKRFPSDLPGEVTSKAFLTILAYSTEGAQYRYEAAFGGCGHIWLFVRFRGPESFVVRCANGDDI